MRSRHKLSYAAPKVQTTRIAAVHLAWELHRLGVFPCFNSQIVPSAASGLPHRRLLGGDHFFDCSSDACGPTEISWMALQRIEQKVPEARAAIARGVAEARRHGYLIIIRRDLTQRHGMAGPDLPFEERRWVGSRVV